MNVCNCLHILITKIHSCERNYASMTCSCLDALRHPFLCGPRWRIDPSMDVIRWGLGSTAVRITEEYIYGRPQVYGISALINQSSFLLHDFIDVAYCYYFLLMSDVL